MIHYTYRIDNLINSKYYIGKHSSDSLDDKYMGSGPLIKAAIAKYGIENFKKTILKTFSTSEEAFEHEAQIVTMVEVKDPMCYNIQPGGKGGQKRFTDEELRERISEQHKEYYQQNKERALEQHKEYYQQNKEQRNEYMREYNQRNKERRRKYNQQNKERISEYQKEYNQQNKEQRNEYMREYLKEYRQRPEVKEQRREYDQRNKERILEQKKKMKQMKTI